MNNNNEDGLMKAIQILDEEVQRLRSYRDDVSSEAAKIRVNELIFSHILSIQHLREAINGEEEE